ncbi:MAG: hypothetical protein M3N48_07855, partial [Verrucomicrobiota bacterium]|nr:hypothetical protein [Verrucomicrobiota bacterium]
LLPCCHLPTCAQRLCLIAGEAVDLSSEPVMNVETISVLGGVARFGGRDWIAFYLTVQVRQNTRPLGARVVLDRPQHESVALVFSHDLLFARSP